MKGRSPDDAVSRAQQHLSSALREGTEAALSLIEAISGPDATRRGESIVPEIAGRLERGLRELAARPSFALPKDFRQALDRAFDQEIARWTRRAMNDPEARTVLRTFVALRESLSDPPRAASREATQSTRSRGSATTSGPPRRPRVQRFEVEE